MKFIDFFAGIGGFCKDITVPVIKAIGEKMR